MNRRTRVRVVALVATVIHLTVSGGAAAGGALAAAASREGNGDHFRLLQGRDRAYWLAHALGHPDVATLSEWVRARGFSPDVLNAVVAQGREPRTRSRDVHVVLIPVEERTGAKLGGAVLVWFGERGVFSGIVGFVKGDNDVQFVTVDAAGMVVPLGPLDCFIRVLLSGLWSCLQFPYPGCVLDAIIGAWALCICSPIICG